MSRISDTIRRARLGVIEEPERQDTPAAQAVRLAAYGAASGRLREQEDREAQAAQSLRLAAYGAATGRAPTQAELTAQYRSTPFKTESRTPAGMETDSGTGTSAAKQAAQAERERREYLDFSTGARLRKELQEAEDALSRSGGGAAEDAAARAAKARLDEWTAAAHRAQGERYNEKAQSALSGLTDEERAYLDSRNGHDGLHSPFYSPALNLAMGGTANLLDAAYREAYGLRKEAPEIDADAVGERMRSRYSDDELRRLAEYAESQHNAEQAAYNAEFWQRNATDIPGLYELAKEAYRLYPGTSGLPEETIEAASKKASGAISGALTSAYSVGMTPFKALGLVESVRGTLPSELGGYADPTRPTDVNSPWFEANRSQQAIRQTVGDNLNSPVGQFLYNAAMSAADSAVNMALGGAIAGASGLTGEALKSHVANTVSWIMGSQVAADTVMEEVQNGYSNAEALGIGIARGLFEHISEKYSIENILKTPGRWYQRLRKSFVSEGAEEVASNWMNRAFDSLIGHKTDVQERYEQIMASGETDEALALARALVEVDGEAFLAGGLSGLGMSGVADVSGVGSAVRTGRQLSTGQTVTELEVGGGTVTVPPVDEATAGLIESGLESPEGTESRELAETLLEKAKAGKTISAEETGRLAQANEAQIRAEASSESRVQSSEETEAAQEEREVAQDEGILRSAQSGRGAEEGVTAPMNTEEEQANARFDEAREIFVKQAKMSEEAGQVLASLYADTAAEHQSALSFAVGAVPYYYAGHAGKAFEDVRVVQGADITPEQARVAWNEGRIAAVREQSAAERAEREAAQKAEADAWRAHERERNAVLAEGERGFVVDDKTREVIGADNVRRIDTVARRLGQRAVMLPGAEMRTYNAQNQLISPDGALVGDDLVLLMQEADDGDGDVTGYLYKLYGHETGHQLKIRAPKQYADLRAALEAKLRDDIARKEAYYNSKNGMGYSHEAIVDEAVNDYIGELFRGGTVLDEFLEENKDNRSLLQRLLDAVRRLVRKLRGIPEQEAAKTVEAKLVAALRAAEQATTESAAAEGGEAAYHFAGENAATADRAALSRAQGMEKQGQDAETIRQETGWFRGADGKWRFEIDDSGMSYRRQGDMRTMQDPEYREYLSLWDKVVLFGNATEEEAARLRELDARFKSVIPTSAYKIANGEATLADVIQHDALFAAYPQLRDIRVQFSALPEGTNGQYSEKQNTIFLSEKLREAPQETLIHEIQHVIQQIEGFAKGASPEYWTEHPVLREDGKKRVEAARKNLERVEQKFRDIWPNDEINLNLAREYDRLTDQFFNDDDADIASIQQQLSEIEGAFEAIGMPELLDEYMDASGQLSLAETEAKMRSVPAQTLYRNTAGEIEARDAAARRNLTAEQRRATRPNTGDENTVFAEDGSEYHLREADADYMAAVESGDMEAAQRMVDEAAKKAGYTVKGYHGTAAQFNSFTKKTQGNNWAGDSRLGPGFYFAHDEKTAQNWSEGTRIIDAWLAIKKPLDLREAATPDIIQQIKKRTERKLAQYDPSYPISREAYESNVKRMEDILLKNPALFIDEFKYDKNGKMTDGIREFLSGLGYDGIISEDEIVVFEPEQIKSADPVTYDDDGNVIPLSERFNPADEDIRYHLREPDAATMEELTRENERLRKRVEYWKGQTKQTRGLHLRLGDLNRLTGQLVKDYAAVLDENESAELREAVARLGRIMREDPKGLQYSELMAHAEDVARVLVQNASELVNDDEYQDYKDFKKWLRGQKITISRQDAGFIPDFTAWKKAHSAIRVGYDNGGLPIDTAYMELSEQFPGFFPESITNPTDQLERIAEVLDSMGPVYDNPYSADMAAAVEYATFDVLERIMDEDTVRPTAPTRADRQAAAARERMNRRLDEQAERYEARLQKYRDTLKKVRERRDEELARVRRAHKMQQQRQSAAKLRARIERHAKELYGELTRPTDKKHIPEALRSSVAKVLQAINLESGLEYAWVKGDYKLVPRGSELGAAGLDPTKKTQLFAAMKEQLAKAEASGEGSFDPNLLGFGGEIGLLDEVIAMGDKPLADMSRDELQKVWDVLKQAEKAVKDWNKAFAAGRYATISEIAGALWGENAKKRDPLTLAGAAGRAQQLFNLDMLTPEAYFHRLGPTGDALFRALRRAQDNDTRLLDLAVQKAREVIGDYDVRKAEQETVKVTLGGEEAEITRAQLMEIYVLLRREQALKHLEGGILPAATRKGVVQNKRAEPYRLNSIEELAEACTKLTDEERRIAEALQRFVTVTAAEWGNAASMAVYGYRKFGGEEHYWPLHVNRQDVNSTIEGESGKSSVKNYGFSKPLTPNANNSVRIGSIFDTFAEHTAEMATYSTHLEIMEDLTRILNYKQRNEEGLISWTTKGIMDRVFGNGGTGYLQTLLEQLSYGVKGETIGGDFMSATSGRYKGSAIGANLRVILQQPTAILRALDMIRPDYLAEGLGSWRRGWRRAQKYAPIAKWKSWGYFDVATGKSIKSLMFNSDSKLSKFNSALMAPAGMADAFAWGQLWSACEKELEAQIKKGSVPGIEPGTEAFYQRVAERFSEIVDRTQVVDGILQRSQIMRSPDRLVKMATSFMAEPTKQYNQFMSAVYDLRHSGGKKERRDAMKHLTRTLLALLASFAANAAAQSLIDGLRDDDREKKYFQRFLGAYPDNLLDNVNPLSFVPWARDVSSIIQGYGVDRMDMTTVSNIVNAVKGTTKALQGEGKKSVVNALTTLAAEAARLFGLPVANIKRDVLAIVNTVATETDNYLMQYEIDKVLYAVENSDNWSRYVDILYQASLTDQEQYEILYGKMIADGISADRIKKRMEKRMEDAQGVTKATELEQRYMSPDQQSRYDGLHKGMERSGLWRQASADERDRVEDKLYQLVAQTDTENSAGTKLQEKIDAAGKAGISEGEYMLYLLALSMADEPTDKGTYGTYTNDEQEAALDMLDGLSREDKSWLWMSTHDSDKNNPYK